MFGEAVYDYATATWTWNTEMYSVLALAADGRPADVVAFERMHPSDREAVAADLARAIETAGPFAGQYRIRDGDGRERSIAYFGDVERGPDGRPLLDERGRPVRLHGFGFDVSRAARAAQREAVVAATQDRAAIEQVKGALMFAYGLDPDAAFGLLTRYSQRGNVKLAVVATRVVELLEEQDEPGSEQSLLHVLERAMDSVTGPGEVAETG